MVIVPPTYFLSNSELCFTLNDTDKFRSEQKQNFIF